MESMDGHDNDENANNTGSTQGGIFSTPDLTVNAENIAQPTQDGQSSEQKRVASIFANTDTGRQAQRLNDAMEAQTAPIADDVVINNGPRTKGKLPIILLMIVLVGAVIGIVVWIVMRNVSGGTSDTTREVSIEQAKVDFDRFATYLLYGESRDELSENYNINYIYKIDQELVTPTDEYWKNADNLLNTAVESYDHVKDNKESLVAALKSYREAFDFVDVYRAVVNPSDDDIVNAYLASGEGGAVSLVNQTYSPFGDSSVAIAYVEARKSQYNALIDILKLYSENGCITDGSMSSTCVNDLLINQEDRVNTLMSQETSSDLTATTLIDQTVTQLKSNCWQLRTQYYGDDVEENL